jgi:hypothetical protein
MSCRSEIETEDGALDVGSQVPGVDEIRLMQ